MVNFNILKIGCVIMAAGNAKRFGKNKLTVIYNGKPLYMNAFDVIPENVFNETVVVSQYDEILQKADEYGFFSIKNSHPEYGISHTVFLGLNVLKDFDAVMFLVSDQPMLKKKSISEIIDIYQKNQDKIVSLSHNGIRGNPCIFPKKYFNELFDLTGDHGGNAVIKKHLDELILCEAGKNELTDIDTESDMTKIIFGG